MPNDELALGRECWVRESSSRLTRPSPNFSTAWERARAWGRSPEVGKFGEVVAACHRSHFRRTFPTYAQARRLFVGRECLARDASSRLMRPSPNFPTAWELARAWGRSPEVGKFGEGCAARHRSSFRRTFPTYAQTRRHFVGRECLARETSPRPRLASPNFPTAWERAKAWGRTPEVGKFGGVDAACHRSSFHRTFPTYGPFVIRTWAFIRHSSFWFRHFNRR